MSKIKVGQIYKDEDAYTDYSKQLIVTSVSKFSCCAIRSDGETFVLGNALLEDLSLIAEYPTWQEAVNSKEFKNG